jgi:hypothetical protein
MRATKRNETRLGSVKQSSFKTLLGLVCNEDRKKEKKKEKIPRVESACVVQDVSNIREVPNNQVCVNIICVSLKQFLLLLDHNDDALSLSLSVEERS